MMIIILYVVGLHFLLLPYIQRDESGSFRRFQRAENG